ncbi:MAG: HIT domain-containing protein [Deltaproteobacteria bacterium]
MKVLWAPWRLSYVEKPGTHPDCFFCDAPLLKDPADLREALVLHTNEHASIIMNRFPYTNGNLMVSPRQHGADFTGIDAGLAAAVLDELRLAVGVLEKAYSPHGLNIGMNLGRAGGAGVDKHMHWHVVPRWEGDTNFMPLIAETRVLPQHIEETYDRLLPLFEE